MGVSSAEQWWSTCTPELEDGQVEAAAGGSGHQLQCVPGTILASQHGSEGIQSVLFPAVLLCNTQHGSLELTADLAAPL